MTTSQMFDDDFFNVNENIQSETVAEIHRNTNVADAAIDDRVNSIFEHDEVKQEFLRPDAIKIERDMLKGEVKFNRKADVSTFRDDINALHLEKSIQYHDRRQSESIQNSTNITNTTATTAVTTTAATITDATTAASAAVAINSIIDNAATASSINSNEHPGSPSESCEDLLSRARRALASINEHLDENSGNDSVNPRSPSPSTLSYINTFVDFDELANSINAVLNQPFQQFMMSTTTTTTNSPNTNSSNTNSSNTNTANITNSANTTDNIASVRNVSTNTTRSTASNSGMSCNRPSVIVPNQNQQIISAVIEIPDDPSASIDIVTIDDDDGSPQENDDVIYVSTTENEPILVDIVDLDTIADIPSPPPSYFRRTPSPYVHDLSIRNNDVQEILDLDIAMTLQSSGTKRPGPAQEHNNGGSPVKNRYAIKCAVCLDAIYDNQPHSTSCGHIFCYACIRASISSCRKCPMCNKKLTMKQIHPVYL